MQVLNETGMTEIESMVTLSFPILYPRPLSNGSGREYSPCVCEPFLSPTLQLCRVLDSVERTVVQRADVLVLLPNDQRCRRASL